MLTRTIHDVVDFAHPFVLEALQQELPAGSYDVDHDEELMDGLSWVAYRRTATFIHLPRRGVTGGTMQLVPLKHEELDALIELDQKQRV